MKKPLRALFYGQTHEHAPGKLETLKKMRDEYEIVAIVDDFPRRSPMYRDQKWDTADYPIVSESEAWKIPGIDVGFVEVTNCDLMEIAAKFAERGIPMHCDKPCGEDFDKYRRVVETCRAKNIPMQIGYMYRTNPALKFVWDFVRAGHLGEIGFIEADMNHAYNHDNYAEYMQTFKGGILYSLGCHLVDMVEPMVKGDPVKVTRVLKSAFGYPAGGRTDGLALMEFPETNVVVRTACEMPGGILSRRLRVDGTNGTVDLCPIELDIGDARALADVMQGRNPPDAIVCANDRTASFVIRTLEAIDLKVPKDVRVAGFDDLAYARGSKVPMTTVRQPCAELGKVALRTLIERILHRDLPPREILLSATLVKRVSA